MTGPLAWSGKRAVILGNGIAGLTAAHTLRESGYDGELTIVGEEACAAYSRPALSKALLREGDLASHELPPPSHGATELLGRRATGLDAGARRVRLDDGTTLAFDGLVIATGSRARRLSDLPGELTLRGIDDALALRARVARRPSVVVVGGGPLGMEIASGCVDAGCAVTVVSQGMPLRLQLGDHLAGVFVAAAREHGVRVVETEAAKLEESGGAISVALAEGPVLEAELVVTAAGDVPNTEWLAGSGLPIAADGSLVVDEHCRVHRAIAAVGDLARFETPAGMRRVPLWSTAIEHAKVAARALVHGEGEPLRYQPYFWTEQFGLSLKAVGHLPVVGAPVYADGGPGGPALMQWPGAAAALNYRIPIPRLRRVAAA